MTKQVVHKRKGRYSNKQKDEAAMLYAIEGSYKKVAKTLGFPKDTVYSWSKDYAGWDELINRVQAEKATEHIATYTMIVDKAQQVVLDKLPEATAAQANIIGATATDKALLLSGRPTRITDTGSGGLAQLAQSFAEQSRAIRELEDNQSRITNSVVSTIDNENDSD